MEDALVLTHAPVSLPLHEPFVIARSRQETFEVVEVAVRFGGHIGYGEATPDDRYEETVESARAFLDRAAPLLGDDPFALEAIQARLAEIPGERAAKAGLDAALHDLCGKLAGLPVFRLLGVPRGAPPTTYTVSLGDPDTMARSAERWTGRGLRRLKLKLGGRDGLDVARVAAVRSASSLPLQVDVNEHWTLDEALEAIPALARLGVEYVEQPLPAGDPDGPALKARSPLPVYVDEDCCVLADVPGCAERAHGINVKLAKAGGIRAAVRVVHAARGLGLRTMIGCMGESGLAIAAACPVAALCDHVDLDGNLLIARDPWDGVTLTDGVQLPSLRPGLGVVRRA